MGIGVGEGVGDGVGEGVGVGAGVAVGVADGVRLGTLRTGVWRAIAVPGTWLAALLQAAKAIRRQRHAIKEGSVPRRMLMRPV